MSLSSGQNLGIYEILEPIGKGGMGEVYRARDTRLDRDVAVKVLPEALSHEPERLARFEREAKLLAALNHPGIATLYGLEQLDGKPVLVMELVLGETLAERIERGALSLEEAVALFGHIAEALGAAHAKGIVHRDLKPPNVKLTPDGKIKILDFGLAKLTEVEPEPHDGSRSQSPTLTKNTALGVILGTASYMSPEQARGKPVDKRTDIWAFGCCLFEALVGRKVFDGETVADVLSKVLQREPEWSALPPSTPAPLRRLIQRCLDKDPDRRVHDIADARLELEESLSAPPVTETRPSFGRTLPLLVAAVAVGALVSWLARGPAPASRDVKRFSINLPAGDEFVVGGIEGPLVAISSDGSKVVYAGVRDGQAQLFLRRIDEPTAAPIPGTENGRMPFFSPDGRSIGFIVDNRQLKTVATDGGPATVLVSSGTSFRGGSWTRRDEILYGQPRKSLSSVSAHGGASQTVANSDVDMDIEHRWPHILPEDKGALFVAQKGLADLTLVVLSFETGEIRLLNESGTYPRYAASGHLVFAREGTLFAAAFDLARLETMSPAVPVLSDVGQGGGGEAYYDIASDGTLVYISGQTKSVTGLVWVDRQGETRPLGPRRRASWRTPRLSPDGRFVVAALEPQDGPPDLWLTDIARESLTRFTSDPPNTRPVWSPDSRSVIYLKGQTSVRQSTETTEPPVTLAECGEPQAVSSDGQLLLCDRRDEAEDSDIVFVRLDGSGEAEPLLDSRFYEHDGRLSPDDRWLAYVSDESGRAEVYVQPFPDLGPKTRISVEGGNEPAWSPSGRELFYRHERMLHSVPFSADGKAGRSTPLFSGDFWTGTNVRGTYYDVSLDGQHFVMIQSEPSEVRPEIHVVLNWFEELKRLVPTR